MFTFETSAQRHAFVVVVGIRLLRALCFLSRSVYSRPTRHYRRSKDSTKDQRGDDGPFVVGRPEWLST